jgi:tRNA(fMet)-specific endonuclease VapC
MKPRYMLDTDTIIFLQRGRNLAAQKRFLALAMDKDGVSEAVMSVITYGEILTGMDDTRQSQAAMATLRGVLSAVPVLPLTQAVGEMWAEIRTPLKKEGRMIGNNDLWIAAHALATDLTVVTNNEKEFRRIPGLKFENWTK